MVCYVGLCASGWVIGSGDTNINSPVANSFTTGSGPGWDLNSVTLKLGYPGSGSAGGPLNVSLFNDNGGTPGTQNLVNFSGGPTNAFLHC